MLGFGALGQFALGEFAPSAGETGAPRPRAANDRGNVFPGKGIFSKPAEREREYESAEIEAAEEAVAEARAKLRQRNVAAVAKVLAGPLARLGLEYEAPKRQSLEQRLAAATAELQRLEAEIEARQQAFMAEMVRREQERQRIETANALADNDAIAVLLL